MQIIKYLTGQLAKGTKIVYLTGNHDEMLRKFAGFRLGSFQIDNKKVMTLDGKKAWIFHGDVFDVTMRYSKWLARLGAAGYDMLILLNTFVNFILNFFGHGSGKVSHISSTSPSLKKKSRLRILVRRKPMLESCCSMASVLPFQIRSPLMSIPT